MARERFDEKEIEMKTLFKIIEVIGALGILFILLCMVYLRGAGVGFWGLAPLLGTIAGIWIVVEAIKIAIKIAFTAPPPSDDYKLRRYHGK